MKKLCALACLVTTFAVLSGCVTAPPTPPTAPTALQRILQRGELIVGTSGDQPPLIMKDKEGNLIGFEADLADMIAAAMNVKLKFAPMAFSDLLPALEAGKVDVVISGLTITSERNLKVAFMGPYFMSGKAFLTKEAALAAARDTSRVNSPDTTLVALKNSTSQTFAEAFIPKAKLLLVEGYEDGVQMVLQGTVQAMVADFPVTLFALLRYPGKGLASVVTPITYEPLGVAMPGSDPLFINWMDNFIGLMEGSGQMEGLKDRWFKDTSWLERLPATAGAK
jgi:polar amino acid transport system substrate-binding protein